MKVNVIIPIYNTDKYLRKCLDSVFSQTYSDIFVICINDGSKDSSPAILKEFYDRFSSKMVIINKENGGLSSARNAGLNYIKDWDNSLITFLDSDDYLSNDFIEHLVNTLISKNADIVCSSFFIDYENADTAPLKRDMPEGLYNPSECIKFLLDNKIQAHSPCKMYKASLWKNIRFDESISFMEDQAITFQLFLKADSIFLDNWAGYYITMRLGSLCQSKMTNKKILDALRSYKLGCSFNYETLSNSDADEIKIKNYNLFGKIYLMMYPRFDKKNATADQINEWTNINNFVKKNKIIRNFKPTNKKEHIKKITFLYVRFAYRFLFNFFTKKYDK